MEQRTDDGLSPYRIFSRAEWAAKRADTPMTLNPDEVTRLRSLHDRLDMTEVEEISPAVVAAAVSLRRGDAAPVPGAAELPRHRGREGAFHHRGRGLGGGGQVDDRARAAGAAGALAERPQGRPRHHRRVSLSERDPRARRPDGEEVLSRKLRPAGAAALS